MLGGALKVLILALSLGVDVFAVSVGVGVRGLPLGLRLRIGAAFAGAEVLMNCIGAAIGALAGSLIGAAAGYIGFGALVLLGTFMAIQGLRESAARAPLDLSRGWGLALASLSVSMDSLGVGFSILYIGVSPFVTLAAIAAVSVGSTSLGLALGRRLGRRVEERGELLGGLLLALTGLVFAALKALHAM